MTHARAWKYPEPGIAGALANFISGLLRTF
jgi:hypothetical protein